MLSCRTQRPKQLQMFFPRRQNAWISVLEGGGKSLAIAAQKGREVYAHDVDPNRMKDLPARATRAGSVIKQLASSQLAHAAPFDLVLCDAPCSGSGAWRRSPDAKWAFTEERLTCLIRTQSEILSEASQLIKPDGLLVYATCSVLRAENEERVETFLKENTGWKCVFQRRFNVNSLGDGFYTAHLTPAHK